MSRPEVSVGDTIIAPRGGQYTSTSGDTIHARNNEYNIPNFYAVVPVIPSKLTVGVGSGSYWGIGTDWAPDSSLRYATTRATLSNIDNSLVAAYQVTEKWSLAVSLDNDYSRADQSKKFFNPGESDGGFELKGNDDAWGYRLATMFKINDQNQVGLMYRSRINHTYEGNVYVDNIGSYYQAHIPGIGSSFETKVEEKSMLPQSVIIGYSFKPTTKWTINADLEWMDWSSIKYETLSFPNATPQQLAFLSGSSSTPEDWHSAFSESIGTQYAVTDRFRIRAGYFHHGKVVPSADFNPVIPDSSSNAVTTGFGFDLTKRLTIDVAYSAMFYDTRDITNTVSNPYGSVNGKYKDFTNIGLVSLTYKF